MFRIAIDTGGTFTDSITADEKGNLKISKVSTTPEDPSIGVLDSLKILAEKEFGMSLTNFLSKTASIILGTTVATNAVAQLTGSRVGMITTKGFRDIIEMRRIIKSDLYNLKLPSPVILVPRHLRCEVEERIKYSGEEIIPLKEDEVNQAISKFKKHKVETIAVCYLHSYINPQHERRTAEILREQYPEVDVVLSSDVLPRISEFERFSTTVLGAYVGRITSDFLRKLNSKLKVEGFPGELLVMANNGGVETVEMATQNPASILSSGPAAGPVASIMMGELSDIEDLTSIDMGGTSLDVCIIPEKTIPTTSETIVQDQRLALNMVDISSIGAGGGSIAWIDPQGILRVGPQSAGAVPGPACYGKGGKNPTVTDADVILGYIPYDYFLGGEIMLDNNLAEKAIMEKVGNPLGIDAIQAAKSIFSLINVNMAETIFLNCVHRGYDPRRFTLCAGGGAGPTHAIFLAKELHTPQVIIPRLASVYCPLGILNSDFKHDLVRTYYKIEDEVNLDEIKKMYTEMEKDSVSTLRKQGVPGDYIKVSKKAEMRYYGQIFELEATIPEGPITKQSYRTLIDNFHKVHNEVFGYSDRTMPIEIINLRVTTIGVLQNKPKLRKQSFGGRDPKKALKRERNIFFDGDFKKTPVYDGEKLVYGNSIIGPSVIEERTTTVVVPEGAELQVDTYGNYFVRLR